MCCSFRIQLHYRLFGIINRSLIFHHFNHFSLMHFSYLFLYGYLLNESILKQECWPLHLTAQIGWINQSIHTRKIFSRKMNILAFNTLVRVKQTCQHCTSHKHWPNCNAFSRCYSENAWNILMCLGILLNNILLSRHINMRLTSLCLLLFT